MPIFPGAANFMQNIILHPCARPAFVYGLTALPAFVKAVATVRYLDMEDIMRERARDVAKPVPRRTGRGNPHSIRGLFQGGQVERRTWQQKGLGFLIKITDPLEFIGMSMLLFFAADRFFYDWQALLLAWRYCEGDPDSGPLQRSRPAGGFFVGAHTMPVLEQNRSGWPTTPIVTNVPAGRYFVTFATNIGYKGAGPGEWKAKIRAVVSGVPFDYYSAPLSLDGPGGGDLVVTETVFFPFGGDVIVDVEGSPVPTGLDSTGAHMMIMKSDFGGPAGLY